MKTSCLPKKQFTSKQIEEYIGIKVNTLHYYVQAGIITPDINRGEGTGYQRLFSETNYFEAAIIAHLMRLGLSKKAIGGIFTTIRNAGERGRLDPRLLFSRAQNETDYLFIFTDENAPGGFSHRFILDGGPAFTKTWKEAKQMFKTTSASEPEFIGDFLSRAFGVIIFNLSQMMTLSVFYFGMSDTGEVIK